jgi:hypothetical protein
MTLTREQIAQLPKASLTRVQVTRPARWPWDHKTRSPWFIRWRNANAWGFRFGNVMVTVRAPWLEYAARALHPHVFDQRQPVAETYPPAGYVQALPCVTHGDQISPDVSTIQITTADFPSIIRAMNLIHEDNGGPSWPNEASPLVAVRWLDQLPMIEAALAGLSDSRPAPEDEDAGDLVKIEGECHVVFSELYSFCNGEGTVVEAISKRSPQLATANAFLNDFFEGWEGEAS